MKKESKKKNNKRQGNRQQLYIFWRQQI